MKNKHAMSLGRMGSGISKNFTPEEIERRRIRLSVSRKLRWNIDLTGRVFGKLTVIKFLKSTIPGGRIWICSCACGNTCEKFTRVLHAASSCGCARHESIKKAAIAGWEATTKFSHPFKLKIKWLWRNMTQRCYNPKNKAYHNYGGRGISVCDEWKNDRYSFYEWATKNGISKGLSIERVNNNGNYCPENCKFITMAEQAKNTRRTKR